MNKRVYRGESVMENTWRKANEDEINLIKNSEKNSFKIRIQVALIIYGIVLVISFIMSGMDKKHEKNLMLIDILGYSPEEPPKYQSRLDYLVYEDRKQKPDESDIDYQIRMQLYQIDFEKFEKMDKQYEEEFYAEQNAEIEAAKKEVEVRIKKEYNSSFPVFLIFGGIVVGIYAGFCLIRKSAYDECPFFVSYGKCIGKEQYRTRHSRSCYMDIEADNEKVYKHVSVNEFNYDDISVGDRILLLKTNDSLDEVDDVYAIKQDTKNTEEL